MYHDQLRSSTRSHDHRSLLMSIPSHVGKGPVETGLHNRKDLVMSIPPEEHACNASNGPHGNGPHGKDLVMSIPSEENTCNAPNSIKTEQLCCLAVEGEVASWQQ